MAEKITMGADGRLQVPTDPIIPFIEGDGTGVDIWPAARLVLDAAASRHGHSIEWKEVLAGEKAYRETGEWLPQETVEVFTEYMLGIKGPLTTPVGGGFRSLNVALRQILDLYVCLRPVRWFKGVPSPVKHPELVDMVIFRENTEDIYAGLEVEAMTPDAKKLRELLEDAFNWQIREDAGIGIKVISKMCSQRLQRAAIQYAVDHGLPRIHWVHKGNIMKFTEGAFHGAGDMPPGPRNEFGADVERQMAADCACHQEPWRQRPHHRPGCQSPTSLPATDPDAPRRVSTWSPP